MASPTDFTTLGRGKIYFDPFTQGTVTTTGEDYFGNTPSLSLQIETQELQHYDSDCKLRRKNLSLTTQIDYMLSFTTDHISPANLARWFYGSSSDVAEAGALAETETFTATVDRYYQLGRTAARIQGVRNVVFTTLTNVGATVTYVLGTDYTVDATLGRVYIIDGGAITTGTDVVATYDITAHTETRATTGTLELNGALRFISDNQSGHNHDLFMPKVLLRPQGELQLKAENEWVTMDFQAEVLQLDTTTEQIFMSSRGAV